ncbi:MAG: ATP-binding protein [Verrucomicrobiales bacterium]|nr:ATP-binding protein [Verrucomicrobiales bacterium]
MPPLKTMPGASSRDETFLVGALSVFERKRFFAEDSEATLRNVALVAKLAAVLVPLFSIVDYIVYPGYFYSFLILRIECVVVILVIWFASRQRFARRWYRIIATLIPLACAIFISLMIYRVGDPGTPYYAGLILCLVAIGALLHWTFKEAIISTCLVFGMFLTVTLPAVLSGPHPRSMAYFINNCVFIGAVGLIVILGSYSHMRLRNIEFQTRMRLRRNQIELREKNTKIQETLATLSETEKQLYQSDKMSFLGELSAGVIHEIGNPLNFTNQALFALRKRLSKFGVKNDTDEVITDMQEGLDRMRGIVSDLREFSHIGDIRGASFSLSEAILGALRMLKQPITESRIELRTDLDSTAKVFGVKNQIVQVFANLVLNAVQAIESIDRPGTLTIALLESAEDLVSIQVADNGPGISEANLKHLFDPFYTTKNPGEGTGLGLSICYRIIEAHGGTIDVTSTLSAGTTFTVSLRKCTA